MLANYLASVETESRLNGRRFLKPVLAAWMLVPATLYWAQHWMTKGLEFDLINLSQLNGFQVMTAFTVLLFVPLWSVILSARTLTDRHRRSFFAKLVLSVGVWLTFIGAVCLLVLN